MAIDPGAVLEQARAWLAEGQRVACATVIATWSSSPRPVGSQMVVDGRGRFAGSVSGGCVEAAVIAAAGQLLTSELLSGEPGAARTLSYGVSTEDAWEVGLPCGGRLEVFLAEARVESIERLLSARRRRESVVVLSELGSGAEEVFTPAEVPARLGEGPFAEQVLEAVERERSAIVERQAGRWFVHVFSPPLRLVVVGAVHLTQALVALAMFAGIEVIVIDPRTAFASAERFPGVTLLHDWPDEALDALGVDARTAVVVLSHDAKLDEPALAAALRSECFYIGALGSQRTQRARRARLSERGFSEEALARIHGPIGLNIGAVTTPEIAVSILAELIDGWRRRPEGRAAGGPGGAARTG